MAGRKPFVSSACTMTVNPNKAVNIAAAELEFIEIVIIIPFRIRYWFGYR